MRISLSTLNQIFQTISTIFQEVLAFEMAEQAKSNKEPVPSSEVTPEANKLLP
ncbi:hypothetical protein [Nostoc sp.]|uniref:hypothetical protein n=1 Tax=Nostoc sp. TaxID=1180 RepID=UPI002FFD3DBB